MASSATALAPFSRKLGQRVPPGSSGHARPGQSKPLRPPVQPTAPPRCWRRLLRIPAAAIPSPPARRGLARCHRYRLLVIVGEDAEDAADTTSPLSVHPRDRLPRPVTWRRGQRYSGAGAARVFDFLLMVTSLNVATHLFDEPCRPVHVPHPGVSRPQLSTSPSVFRGTISTVCQIETSLGFYDGPAELADDVLVFARELHLGFYFFESSALICSDVASPCRFPAPRSVPLSCPQSTTDGHVSLGGNSCSIFPHPSVPSRPRGRVGIGDLCVFDPLATRRTLMNE